MIQYAGIKERQQQLALTGRPVQLYTGNKAFQFKDNRPRSVIQRKLVDGMANGKSEMNPVTQLKIIIGDIVIEDEYSLALEELKGLKEKIDKLYPGEKRATGYRRLLDIIWVREKRVNNIGDLLELNFKTEGTNKHLTNLKEIAASFSGGSNVAKAISPGQLQEFVQGGPVSAMSPGLRQQEDQRIDLPHQVEELKNTDIHLVIKALKDWQGYIRIMQRKYEQLLQESRDKKGKGYYSDDTADGFRSQHKRIVQMEKDFYGANNEINSILRDLEKDDKSGNLSDYYLVAIKDGKIQGLLQKVSKDSSLIANIVVNPDNIEPRPGAIKVKNTLKDLLKACIEINLAGKRSELRLYALTTRVKKIYDHYGFRVEKTRDGELVDRPKVDRNKQNWRTEKGKQQTAAIKRTDPWFKGSNMRMTLGNQEKFLKGQYAK